MDHTRREIIRKIVQGAVYSVPVIATIAAPARLLAQGPSEMGMGMGNMGMGNMGMGNMGLGMEGAAPGTVSSPGRPLFP